jgi:hypothetical protein
MARYILIDNCSGYIWGDSADLDGKVFTGTAVEFAAALDRSVDPSAAVGREYVEEARADNGSETGYHVYEADGAPAFHEGQSQSEAARAVKMSCPYDGFIRVVETVEV